MSLSNKPPFFRGQWILPEDPSYDAVRSAVFNTRSDPRPPVIARCLGESDVMLALERAREGGQSVEVRSTGWSLAGFTGTDAFTIDLSLMRGVRVDPVTKTAWIQGGVRGGDLQVEAAVHGLAAVTGMLSGTGVGLILGGGISPLSRSLGYAADSVLAVRLITADGELITASPDENAELFWGVRGSMGNFGVVTELQVQLHDVPDQVLAGAVIWTGDTVRPAVQAFAEAMEWASEEMNVLGLYAPGSLTLWVCHVGPAEVADQEVARLLSVAEPADNSIDRIAFRDLVFAYDAEFVPQRALMEEESVSALDESLVDLIEYSVNKPLPEGSEGAWMVELSPRFGAFTRDPERPSAARPAASDPVWSIVPGAWWSDAAEDRVHREWVADTTAGLRELALVAGLVQVNGIGSQPDEDRLVRVYGDGLPRLRALKAKWDPRNTFRSNLNIAPPVSASKESA